MNTALKEKKYSRIRFRIATATLIAAIMAVLFFMQCWFQMNEKKRGAERSAEVRRGNVEEMLAKNEADEAELVASLKDDYIIRAKAASYIVESDPSLENNIGKLKKIACFLQVDELHLFDLTGTIYGGTNRKYYGYSFDSGEQLGFFKPMLNNRFLSLCQDVTPNTAEGKPMMYAMVWREDGKGMVQVGLEPTRLLEAMRKNDISYLMSQMLVAQGVTIYIADRETGVVLGSNQQELTGRALEALGCRPSQDSGSEIRYFTANILGEPSYCVFQAWGSYLIGVSEPRSEVNKNLGEEMRLALLYLAVVGLVLIFVIWHSTELVEKEREERLREQQVQNRLMSEALEKAEVANRAKSTFLFNMSHDIRTPMNAIIGFRNLLEKHQEEPEKRADYLRKIDDASNVLLSIINNVLEMARIEKGTLEIDETAWSAEQFNDTLYSVFHEMMAQKDIAFTRQVHVKNHYVFCDSSKLREIFLNVLSNAYKYTNPGGKVDMHLEEIASDREGYVLYQTTISDTGIGISEEFLPHIFEEFARENNTTDNKIEGTGLGMPIVKRLVDFLDGTIEVKSEKGVGTTVIITLPHRIAEKSNLVMHAGVELDPKLFQGKHILLAEDNELNAEIAIEILKEAGFVIERAEDGQICVDMLKKAPSGYYDLILMDIQMPNMNGYDATRTILALQDSGKANIPIMAMTANAFEEDKREAYRSGMNGHIAKPINVRELMKELANILG